MEAPLSFGSEVSPAEIKRRLDRGEKIQILDVRETFEYRLVNIGGLLIPLSELEARLNELDPNTAYAIICHHGVRSRHAMHFLIHEGFNHVVNILGGIERWAVEVDPKLPRY